MFKAHLFICLLFTESSRPESSYFNTETGNPSFFRYEVDQRVGNVGLDLQVPAHNTKLRGIRRSFSSSNSITGDDEDRVGYSINPDTFTFAEVSHCGKSIGMPELGVHMIIPEGALDKGYTEEVFLAVMTEGRDRPRLCGNQTLLSPVILAGPPRVSFRKPVVISFGHCANLSYVTDKSVSTEVNNSSNWELALYHCDSLFSDHDDTPWVKLATLLTPSNQKAQSTKQVVGFQDALGSG